MKESNFAQPRQEANKKTMTVTNFAQPRREANKKTTTVKKFAQPRQEANKITTTGHEQLHQEEADIVAEVGALQVHPQR